MVRGQILLVPLSDLVLTKQGKELADKQRSEHVGGGDVRQKQASIDAELPVLREHVRSGRYADALTMANKLIGAGDLTSSHVVSIHREMAIALQSVAEKVDRGGAGSLIGSPKLPDYDPKKK